jgi:hypothetical protein
MSAKNRLKGLREVTVNGVVYFWTVIDSELKIWSHKKTILIETTTDNITAHIVIGKIQVYENN